jgi:hypothetical protein
VKQRAVPATPLTRNVLGFNLAVLFTKVSAIKVPVIKVPAIKVSAVKVVG